MPNYFNRPSIYQDLAATGSSFGSALAQGLAQLPMQQAALEQARAEQAWRMAALQQQREAAQAQHQAAADQLALRKPLYEAQTRSHLASAAKLEQEVAAAKAAQEIAQQFRSALYNDKWDEEEGKLSDIEALTADPGRLAETLDARARMHSDLWSSVVSSPAAAANMLSGTPLPPGGSIYFPHSGQRVEGPSREFAPSKDFAPPSFDALQRALSALEERRAKLVMDAREDEPNAKKKLAITWDTLRKSRPDITTPLDEQEASLQSTMKGVIDYWNGTLPRRTPEAALLGGGSSTGEEIPTFATEAEARAAGHGPGAVVRLQGVGKVRLD